MKWNILLNPFERYSEKSLLVFGITFTLFGSAVAYLMKARFDGVFDMHLVENISFIDPFLDNILNIFTLVLLFVLFGKSINHKTRWIDILSVAIVARIPFYLLPLLNIGGVLEKSLEGLLNGMDFQDLNNPPAIEPSDLLIILLFSGVSILCLGWFIVLFWNGFKTATNAKGIKNVIFFIILLILAEVISKILISIFNS
ncbi:MAG: hypothetical protein AB7D46_06935 [Flavobacteriaceae bacterium]